MAKSDNLDSGHTKSGDGKSSGRKSRKKDTEPSLNDDKKFLLDLQLRQVELELQNEELKSSKQQLAALVHKYSLKFDLAPIGFFSLSPDGLIFDFNNTGASLLDHDRSELINHNFSSFLSPDSFDCFKAFLDAVFLGKEKSECDVTLVDRNSGIRSLHLDANVALQEQLCYLTAYDTSEFRTSEALIREEKELYQSVFRNSQIRSLLLNAETGAIINANCAAASFYGFSVAQLKTMNFSDLIISAPNEINPLLNIFISGKRDHFVFRQRLSGGQVRYVQACLEPVRTDVNSFLLATFEDITDRRLLEEVNQERKFWEKEALQQTGTGTFTLDFISDSWSCSEFIEELFGIGTEYDKSVNGFISLIHPDQKAGVQHHLLSEVIARKQAFDKEFCIIRPSDKTELWIKGKGELVFDDAGILIKLSGTLQDVTGRKRSDEFRAEAEKMYQLLMDTSPDGIVFFDNDGIITELSSILLAQMEVRKKEVFLGKHFVQFIPRSERKNIYTLIEQTNTEELPVHAECLLLKPERSTYIAEISLVQIREIHNNHKAYIAIVRDVTSRKKKEQEQIHLDRMAHLGEMATGMAHEINQPLNNISLALENVFHEIKLKDSLHDTYLQHKSKKIFDNIIKIKNLIEHIREFARSDHSYALQTLDINETIQNAISVLMTKFDEDRIDLVLDLDYDIPPYTCDTMKVEQVIMNLLLNAKDALQEKEINHSGDFSKVIKIKSYQNKKLICIEITDNGIGIKSSEIDKIMHPFYTTKETGKGTGLGLSISYGIVADMNGKIEVESKYRMGTTFRILLPV